MRVFEPLEGRVIDEAGALADSIGFMVTRSGRDVVDFTEDELEEMLAAVRKSKQCTECKGTGTVAESNIGEQYDRGDGVMYGSASWTNKRCPNGCRGPQAYL